MPVLDPNLAGSDRSLSAAYVEAVLPDLLAHYGLSRETVLARAGLGEASFSRPDQLLPLVDVLRLFLVILQACGDPGLGFEIGKRGEAALLSGAGLCDPGQRGPGPGHRPPDPV